MKTVLSLFLIFFASITWAQQMTPEQWGAEAMLNTRLLPKYGRIPKTKEQQENDRKYIEEMSRYEQFNGDRTAASHHLIGLGFTYLYRGDLKTAMYRFNQAYLLDSLNNDIYWGYGAVYMTLGNYQKAREQYEEGLSINPTSTHLLTDYGTYFLSQFYEQIAALDEKLALSNLESAIEYMEKSYQIDPADQNTTFKLSICYWNKDDCENAWKYYNICKKQGGQPITPEFTRDLKERCKRKK